MHLVNLTNPMMMKGPIREIIPIGRQLVSVAIPGKSATARLLVSGKVPLTRVGGGRIEVEVPEIATNEVVLIEFGA